MSVWPRIYSPPYLPTLYLWTYPLFIYGPSFFFKYPILLSNSVPRPSIWHRTLSRNPHSVLFRTKTQLQGPRHTLYDNKDWDFWWLVLPVSAESPLSLIDPIGQRWWVHCALMRPCYPVHQIRDLITIIPTKHKREVVICCLNGVWWPSCYQ